MCHGRAKNVGKCNRLKFSLNIGSGSGGGTAQIKPVLPWKGRAIAYENTPRSVVMLNSFQHPFLVTNGGFSVTMDPEINSG